MSILLEALKKSEQERQLGQTPTLRTHPDERFPGEPGLNQWLVLAMVVMSACIMAWFGWQQFQVPQGVESPQVAVEAGEDQPVAEDATPQARTLTESYQAEDRRPASQDAEPSERIQNERADRDSLRRSVSDYTAETVAPEPVAETLELAEPLAATAEPEQAPVADSPPAEADEPPPEQEQARRQGVEPHVAEPISYWELPQGIREGLPIIKITVLVYAEQPRDRFLLSNGQRLVEKDSLEGGVVLDEIRKDGAVFLYRNYRFLVKG